jgi:hypothetical protein
MNDFEPVVAVWLKVVLERNSARISDLPLAIREAKLSSGDKQTSRDRPSGNEEPLPVA